MNNTRPNIPVAKVRISSITFQMRCNLIKRLEKEIFETQERIVSYENNGLSSAAQEAKNSLVRHNKQLNLLKTPIESHKRKS